MKLTNKGADPEVVLAEMLFVSGAAAGDELGLGDGAGAGVGVGVGAGVGVGDGVGAGVGVGDGAPVTRMVTEAALSSVFKRAVASYTPALS